MAAGRNHIKIGLPWLAAAAAAGLLGLSGCTSTYVISERATPCNIHKGVPYYLPKKLAKITVTEVEPGRHAAMLGELPPVADHCQFYVAIPVQNMWRSNVVDIRTTPDGLLSSAYITGERRNAGIADNIRLSTAFYNKEGLKDELVRNLHYVEDASIAAVAGREAGVVVFESAFDPSSIEDVEAVNHHIRKYKMRLEIAADGAGVPESPTPDRVVGLLVRPAVMKPMYVKTTSDGKTIAHVGGAVPVAAPLFNLPVKGGFLAKHSHNVELREGALTGYYTRQPSEVAGFFQATQETVEDVASVAAAVIAPVAAALEVKRPASGQSSGGEAAGAAAPGSEETPENLELATPATGAGAGSQELDKLKQQLQQATQASQQTADAGDVDLPVEGEAVSLSFDEPKQEVEISKATKKATGKVSKETAGAKKVADPDALAMPVRAAKNESEVAPEETEGQIIEAATVELPEPGEAVASAAPLSGLRRWLGRSGGASPADAAAMEPASSVAAVETEPARSLSGSEPTAAPAGATGLSRFKAGLGSIFRRNAQAPVSAGPAAGAPQMPSLAPMPGDA